MGRKEASEKGMWKLEKEQTRCVTSVAFHCFWDKYRRSALRSRFDLFIPLHRLWLGYMSELLGLASSPSQDTSNVTSVMPATAGMHAKLVKSDFHGSFITGVSLDIRVEPSHLLNCTSSIVPTVKQSKNPCLIGLSGIVIHETENAFKVVTKKDQLKRPFNPVAQLK